MVRFSKPHHPLFIVLLTQHIFKSRSLKVETVCMLPVFGVMPVVQAAMHRISGDMEASCVLPESAVLPPLAASALGFLNRATTGLRQSHGISQQRQVIPKSRHISITHQRINRRVSGALPLPRHPLSKEINRPARLGNEGSQGFLAKESPRPLHPKVIPSRQSLRERSSPLQQRAYPQHHRGGAR